MITLLTVHTANPNLGAWLSLGLAMGLARDGRSVTLVDADLVAALLTRTLGAGADSMTGLLAGRAPQPQPLALEGSAGRLTWLPARGPLESANTAWVATAPQRDWPTLAQNLRALHPDHPEDLQRPHFVLVNCPAGANAAGLALGVIADAAVVGVEPEDEAHAAMSAVMDNILALRGRPLPLTRLAAQRDPRADDEGFWLRRWRSSPHERLPMTLSPTDPGWVEVSRRMCERLGDEHPDALLRYRRAAASGDLGACEQAFHLARQQDPRLALLVFEEVCRQADARLEASAGAMLALASEDPMDTSALRLVAGVAVQRLRLERPTPVSLLVREVLDLLMMDLSPDSNSPADAALLLHAAFARLQVASWRRSQGDELGTLPDEALELVAHASGMNMKAENRLRLAVVCGDHARLTGSMATYALARSALAMAEERLPDLGLKWGSWVLTRYACVCERREMWEEVVTRAHRLMGLDPGRAHHLLAIAFTHLGDLTGAIRHLGMGISVGDEVAQFMFADPDLEPLFRGAGKVDYDFYPLKNLQ